MMTSTIPILKFAPLALMLAFLAWTVAACGDSASTTAAPEIEDSPPAPTVIVNVTIGDDGIIDATSSPSLTVPPPQSPSPTPISQSSVRQLTGDQPEATLAPKVEPPQSEADFTRSQMLAAFEEVLSDIYESSVPSVVYIRVPNPSASTYEGLPGIPDDLLWAAGSGFVWDDEGHIVTNHHVVENAIGETDQVTVIFADDTAAKGTVVGGDPHSDLAVIKLEEGDWDLYPARLGDSDSVRVGQLTVAIGSPFGQEFTMTSGIVSAVGRNIRGLGEFTIPEVIQTDSAINPGNSGGPLLDRLGQVIGINTQIVSRTGSFSGIGMAVPVNIAKRVIPPLIADGEFNYPWLGVSIAPMNSDYAWEMGLPADTRGAFIISVVQDSPADKAGLRGSDSTVYIDGIEFQAGGDVIVSIGDYSISNPNGLIAHLTYYNSPEDEVSLGVLRDGQLQDIEVTLGERPRTHLP